jgi:hypothetical protein
LERRTSEAKALTSASDDVARLNPCPSFINTTRKLSYVVDGRVLEGSYRATFPQDCGHSFEILYDPEAPRRNTGSDMLDNRWLKWGAGIIGIGLALLAIWLWGDQDWFHD